MFRAVIYGQIISRHYIQMLPLVLQPEGFCISLNAGTYSSNLSKINSLLSGENGSTSLNQLHFKMQIRNSTELSRSFFPQKITYATTSQLLFNKSSPLFKPHTHMQTCMHTYGCAYTCSVKMLIRLSSLQKQDQVWYAADYQATLLKNR